MPTMRTTAAGVLLASLVIGGCSITVPPPAVPRTPPFAPGSEVIAVAPTTLWAEPHDPATASPPPVLGQVGAGDKLRVIAAPPGFERFLHAKVLDGWAEGTAGYVLRGQVTPISR